MFVCTVVLTVLSFPPFNAPEFAYAFAVPAIFWAYSRPRFKIFAWTMFAAQAVAWTIILGWLHNVTWGGLFLLGPLVGAWVGVWYLAVWWTMPQLQKRSKGIRVLAIFALGALWVLIEWTRTWLLGGFPWLPLAASQWQRTILLQIASYAGAYSVSFVLVVFNLGFAAYAHRLIRGKLRGLKRRSAEFMAALLLLLFSTVMLISEVFGQQRSAVARVALVQPHVPQTVKWDEKQGPLILDILQQTTQAAVLSHPDLILWPESVTPWSVQGDPTMRQWVASLSAKAKIPLILGSNAVESSTDSRPATWFNSAFHVDPVSGVQPAYYSKQKLVPFGEYLPLRPMLGWLGKFVEIGDGDFSKGRGPVIMNVNLRGKNVPVAPLICSEDWFPALARADVRAGAELFVVLSNNAWFGEGAASYQHAAHSVLRAVETRRPVIRVSNGGWSGWIDEFGTIRNVMEKDGTIYYRGTQTFEITRDLRWVGRETFYVRNGDWFLLVCAGLILLGAAGLKYGSDFDEEADETA